MTGVTDRDLLCEAERRSTGRGLARALPTAGGPQTRRPWENGLSQMTGVIFEAAEEA